MAARKSVPRLRRGAAAATRKGMGANYTRETMKGAPRKQAIAIMLSEAGKSRKGTGHPSAARSRRKG